MCRIPKLAGRIGSNPYGAWFLCFLFILTLPHMAQAAPAILALLLKAYNRPVKDYYFFPDVIFVGRQRMEPEDFFQLVAEGYLQQTHRDSFGRIYTLSAKAEQLLHQSLQAKKGKSRKLPVLAKEQGSFCFT
jgi:hypothetical protein